MDYRLFRNFEKVDPAALPRVLQEQGLFLVELRFSPEGETRSVPANFHVERSRYGEVCKVILRNASALLRPEQSTESEALLSTLKPPVTVCWGRDRDELAWIYIDQPAARVHAATGLLIFNEGQQLCSILTYLK